MGIESLCLLHFGNVLYMFVKRGKQVKFVILILHIHVNYLLVINTVEWLFGEKNKRKYLLNNIIVRVKANIISHVGIISEQYYITDLVS